MGPPDNTKVALGVAAAAAVVVVSYFLAKKLGITGDDTENQRQKAERQPAAKTSSAPALSLSPGAKPGSKKDELYASVVEEIKAQSQQRESRKSTSPERKQRSKTPPASRNSFAPEVPLESESKYQPDEQGYLPDSATENSRSVGKNADNGQNQASFVVIGEGAVLPSDGKQAKKSDRSSDESSYDVIDDDRLEEAIDDDEGDEMVEKDQHKKDTQESFMENETSMVVIEDSDRSGMSKSGSSFYVSADENGGEGSSGERRKKEGEDASVSEEEKTVMYTGDSKSNPSSADTEAEVGNASGNALESVASEEAEPDLAMDLSQEEITEVLNSCQNSPANVSKEDIGKLVTLLRKNIPQLHSLVLNCLVRLTAFTQNIGPLRENNCASVLTAQVQEACKAVMNGQAESEASLTSLCQVLTNLSMDPKLQEQLEDTVQPLVDLLLLDSTNDSVRLSILRPLVNFSSTTTYHGHYTRAIRQLYHLLDTGSHMAKVQSLKVLVNLSLNEEIVPNMLAVKAPMCLLDLLDQDSTDLLLRAVTMLANVQKAIRDGTVTPDTLPVEAKAASPETMYMALTSLDRRATLRSKVFLLTRHEDEDVSSQASRLYQFITETTEKE